VLDREERSTVIDVLSEWFRLWAPASFIDGENIVEGGEYEALGARVSAEWIGR
jgi:hypothetical protein